MSDDARVEAMMGEPYSLYTDTAVMNDYMDFVLIYLMPPGIYDMMPLPLACSSRPGGSSHNTGGASTSAVATTSEVPFVRLDAPTYNIPWAYGGSVRMLHHPNAMDPEDLVLTEEVLRPEVFFSSFCIFDFLISFFSSG